MKYFLIAGEASGDIHGSQLMMMLKKHDKNAEFVFWGGDQMSLQGGKLLKHISELAFMGFLEVILNLFTILKNFKSCKIQISEHKPDVVILIDYPGFNLRIASFAKKLGVKVFYYISPTVWAWKELRVKIIKKYVDKLFVILPFEKAFYKKHDYDVIYEGHPLIDFIDRKIKDIPGQEVFFENNDLDIKPIIAILPGSREQEIKKMLPVMLSVVDQFPNYQFIIAATSSLDEELYAIHTVNKKVKLVIDQTYALLKFADSAIVTSGTATLETAMFGVPEIVCYKTSGFSYSIGKLLVSIKFFSLVNLIMDKEVVKELLQEEVTTNNILAEMKKITENESYRGLIVENYSKLNNMLGKSGVADRIAKIMVDELRDCEEIT